MPDTKLAKLKTATVESNNGLSAGSSERLKEHKIPHAHGFVNYRSLQITAAQPLHPETKYSMAPRDATEVLNPGASHQTQSKATHSPPCRMLTVGGLVTTEPRLHLIFNLPSLTDSKL